MGLSHVYIILEVFVDFQFIVRPTDASKPQLLGLVLIQDMILELMHYHHGILQRY